jgi:hypothetical protein
VEMVYIFLIVLILGIILQLFLSKKPKTKNRIIEVVLLWLLFVMVGLSSIWGFIGHAFLPAQIAASIGWPAGNPFQFEVAMANLSYGILGILCLKFRDNFWVATIIAISVFYFGAAYGHLMDIMKNANYAPGNAGFPLYFDIILPILLIVLLIAYQITKPQQKTS